MKNFTLSLFFFLVFYPVFSQAPVCGGTFTDDNSGSSGWYNDNTNEVVTICPDTPGNYVTVTFDSFSIVYFGDGLYVYNGSSTAAPIIPNVYDPEAHFFFE